MKEIYLDNAAATPMAREAIRATTRAMAQYANPSSFNDAGRAASATLLDARVRIGRFLNARPSEILLCASGSEANTLALFGATQAFGDGAEVVVADTEHASVLESARLLEEEGYRRVRIPVDAMGRISPDDVYACLSSNSAIVSVMYANNEIGTIQQIVHIGQAVMRWRRAHQTQYPLFHVDACQAVTTLPMDVQRLGADLVTINGAKAYGPHGVAALFIRRGVGLTPRVLGGSQEGGLRAGTEDVASAVGLAVALETIRPVDAQRMAVLRDRLISGIRAVLPEARLNGPEGAERLAGNVNVSIPRCTSEELLLELDAHGMRAGSGSACTAHRVEPSHVLVAIGTPRLYLDGALRFSLGRTTSKADIDAVVRVLPEIVQRLRDRKHG